MAAATASVLEQRLPLDLEVSVILARAADGAVRVFPVAENRHRDGILNTTLVPARVDARLTDEARALAEQELDQAIEAITRREASGRQLKLTSARIEELVESPEHRRGPFLVNPEPQKVDRSRLGGAEVHDAGTHGQSSATRRREAEVRRQSGRRFGLGARRYERCNPCHAHPAMEIPEIAWWSCAPGNSAAQQRN